MESETSRTISRHKQEDENWRRRCGCIRTSDKLRQILDKFPPPPPPTPEHKEKESNPKGNTCISAICTVHQPSQSKKSEEICCDQSEELKEEEPKQVNKSWRVLTEVVQLIQVSVTATALALYYIIFCYMQLIYYSLRSVLYFHNADGPMKITIAVVTVTSLIVAINFLSKIEKLIRIY